MAGILEETNGDKSSRRVMAVVFGGLLIIGGIATAIIAGILGADEWKIYACGVGFSALGVVVSLVLAGMITMTDVREILKNVPKN